MFTMTLNAYLKWLHLARFCDTEIGFLPIVSESSRFHILDLVIPPQECTPVSFDWVRDSNDPSEPDPYDQWCADTILALKPGEVLDMLMPLHTHPGDSAEPSSVDDRDFNREDRFSWPFYAQLILARGNAATTARYWVNDPQRKARLVLNSSVKVVGGLVGQIDPEAWEADAVQKIRTPQTRGTFGLAGGAGGTTCPATWEEQLEEWEREYGESLRAPSPVFLVPRMKEYDFLDVRTGPHSLTVDYETAYDELALGICVLSESECDYLRINPSHFLQAPYSLFNLVLLYSPLKIAYASASSTLDTIKREERDRPLTDYEKHMADFPFDAAQDLIELFDDFFDQMEAKRSSFVSAWMAPNGTFDWRNYEGMSHEQRRYYGPSWPDDRSIPDLETGRTLVQDSPAVDEKPVTQKATRILPS